MYCVVSSVYCVLQVVRLGRVVAAVLAGQDCTVLDVGAGAGHLARHLAVSHGLRVACLDGDGKLTEAASKFDTQLAVTVAKQGEEVEVGLPRHLTAWVGGDTDLAALHRLLATSDPGHSTSYGLVGLHTCGDLGPGLTEQFTRDPAAAMLASVPCCYHKTKHSFPMSDWVGGASWAALTYTSTELACHATEMYRERLLMPDCLAQLRVHCYRATLEWLLATTRGHQYRHTALATVPRAHSLPFPQYAARATARLVQAGLEPLTSQELGGSDTQARLERWGQAVAFYTLRLSLAPVIGRM